MIVALNRSLSLTLVNDLLLLMKASAGGKQSFIAN